MPDSTQYDLEYRPTAYWTSKTWDDADDDEETNESAYVELVEYVRVGVQLAYEELAPLRTPLGSVDAAPPDAVH